MKHKMASFHHMIHRMLTIPLTQEAIKKETSYIKEVADINGYNTNIIDKIINKKKRQINLKNQTTLTVDKPQMKRVATTFNVEINKGLKTKLKKFNIDLVYTSRPNQLGTKLTSTKDPVNEKEKSGVYKVTCPICNKTYIGQTKRALATRIQEHLKEARDAKKKNNPHIKSNVARHILSEEHHIDENNATIIKSVRESWKLETVESIQIHKHQSADLLNGDKGNVSSWLFKYLRKPKHT
jgi:uncharacterized Zn finger protein (UPF0148 family)